MSSCSEVDGSKPIRGGIPIAFPQFADCGDLPLHGFARNEVWDLIENSASSGRFQLRENENTLKVWPFRFTLTYTIRLVGNKLKLTFEVLNREEVLPFSFSHCLHSYFKVEDIHKVDIYGFDDTKYIDKCDNKKSKLSNRGDKSDGNIDYYSEGAPSPSAASSLSIQNEANKSGLEANKKGYVDRVYENHNNQDITLANVGASTHLHISQSSSYPQTVLYNPYLGDKQGPSFPDFDDEGYKHMVCVVSTTRSNPQEVIHSCNPRLEFSLSCDKDDPNTNPPPLVV